MAILGRYHQELDECGVGQCSMPMWAGTGAPAGFCSADAYGKVLPGARIPGYVPFGLACPIHGGPDSRVFMDGDMWCAVYPDFVNLAESPAGFDKTPEEARANLKQELEAQDAKV